MARISALLLRRKRSYLPDRRRCRSCVHHPVGGGACSNDDGWIDGAMLRALRLAGGHDLDVVVVSYGRPSDELVRFVRQSGFAAV